MKRTLFVLTAGLILLGAGCSPLKQADTSAPDGERAIVSDVDKPNGECPLLRTKNNGPIIYSASDAAAQFGGEWKILWLDSSEYSCWYDLTTGTYGESDFRSIALTNGSLFSTAMLQAIMEGRGGNYGQGFSIKAVPGIGDKAFLVASPSSPNRPALYVDKHDNLMNITCETCSNDELIQIGKTAAERMR